MRTMVMYKDRIIRQESEHRFYTNRLDGERGKVMFTTEERAKAYIDKHSKTKVERILNEVQAGVLAKMEDTILSGDNRFHYEKEYGEAYIDIEFHEVYCGAFLIDDWDVHVSHEDARKESPMLEAALRAVLPDWFKVKEELLPSA